MRLPAPALAQRAASTLAAVVLATSAPLQLSAAPPPTSLELARLSFGLARIDYLLENWDAVTTVCNGLEDSLEDAQVMRTQNQNKCYKTPLKVQKYIGAASTLDPLFKADKLMIRAQPLVVDANQDKYGDAVDSWITKQQMSSTMAYTSQWSGIENPNGSIEAIEEALAHGGDQTGLVANVFVDEAELSKLVQRALVFCQVQGGGLPVLPRHRGGGARGEEVGQSRPKARSKSSR